MWVGGMGLALGEGGTENHACPNREPAAACQWWFGGPGTWAVNSIFGPLCSQKWARLQCVAKLHIAAHAPPAAQSGPAAPPAAIRAAPPEPRRERVCVGRCGAPLGAGGRPAPLTRAPLCDISASRGLAASLQK